MANRIETGLRIKGLSGLSGDTNALYVTGNSFINGDVNITGNVNVIGTATTLNTQVVQTRDNRILLNYSGTNLTAIGGGIEVLSAKTDGNNVSLTTDINGDWNSNTGFNISGRTSDATANGLKVVNSSGTSNFVVRNDGYVRIGTTTGVRAEFDINANGGTGLYKFIGGNGNWGIHINPYDSTFNTPIISSVNNGISIGSKLWIEQEPQIITRNADFNWDIYGTSSWNIRYYGTSNKLFTVKNDGNVGIGTSTPDSKLVIKGSDSSLGFGLKVQNSGGTDTLKVRNDGLITVNDVTNGSDSSNSVRFFQTIPATGTYNYGFYSVGAPTYANYAAVGNTSRTHFYSSESPKTAYEADMAATVSSPYRVGFNASVVGINTGGTNVALYSDVRNGVSNYTIYSVNGDSFFNKTSMTLNGKTNGSDSVFSVNNSGGTNNFVVRNDGNVGIGTSTPTEKLEVNGNTKITGTLNIGTIGSGSPLINLGLDSSGNVVTGTTTTSSGGGTFTGGTVTGPTNFTGGLTANTLTVGTFFVGRKFSSSESFTGSVTKTVTHNLNTQDVIVQLWDSSNNLLNGATIVTNNVNSVDITVSSTATYKVVIIG